MRKTRALTLGALALASVVACSSPTPSATPMTAPPTPSTASPTPTTASPPPSTTSPTPTATPTSTASAEGALAGFIAAARAVDARLRDAADLINGGVRSDTIVVDKRTVAAVKATDPSAVAATIPAGMPPELMLPVLTVYSDVVSRSASMTPFRYPERYPRVPSANLNPSNDQIMLGCLAGGAPAAHRFAADLAAVVTSARSTPPLRKYDPASLASAQVAVRLEEIRLRNTGCDGCGGYVATTLVSIVWDGAAPTATERTGHIGDTFGGLPFTATFAPGDGWTVVIWVC